jgi:DNA-nicking Smr family endonuclease
LNDVSRKRDLHDDERALWNEVMRDVRRLCGAKAGKAKPDKKRVGHVLREPPALPAPARPSIPSVAPSAKPKKASVPAFGIDGATAERLRRGKVEPDATLDLHGMTQARAHDRLVSFVRRAHENGFRCILVVTGKGAPRPAREAVAAFVMPERSQAGVLNVMVPRWLEEDALRSFVVGVQGAHQRHGGAGAIYVYLRRKRGG